MTGSFGLYSPSCICKKESNTSGSHKHPGVLGNTGLEFCRISAMLAPDWSFAYMAALALASLIRSLSVLNCSISRGTIYTCPIWITIFLPPPVNPRIPSRSLSATNSSRPRSCLSARPAGLSHERTMNSSVFLRSMSSNFSSGASLL